jgi:U-box domain
MEPEAAPAQHYSAGSPDDSPGAHQTPVLQQPAIAMDASHAKKEPEWWRCPLSGEVMRDPVLWGGEGHSFEREALEQWLAANPGVHPLGEQPLPLEADSMLPNHALRNLIQHLQPA